MSQSFRPALPFATIVAGLVLASAAAHAEVRFLPPDNLPNSMKKLEGQYHTLYHDLSVEESHEAILRMDAMTEEYLQRTRGFSGRLQGKMPLVLFRNKEDYYAAGGMRGSAGAFTGSCLMAVAGPKLTVGTWHTIQHEGFHEFAAAVINPNMPTWVNEGLAEYFGEAVFTGDGFVSGMLPHGRVERVQEAMKQKTFRSVEGMMDLSHGTWNSRLDISNYDQAWSMTQFLAHGDDGKYQNAFGLFMEEISHGWAWQRCWTDAFGSAAGFDAKWQAWWLAQTDEASVPGYARAATQMLASYLARGTSQKQTFAGVNELLSSIRDSKVTWHRDDVLPAGLAGDCDDLCTAITKAGGKFSLQVTGTGPAAKPQGVVCELKDGTKIIATFKLNGARVRSVESRIEKAKPAAAPTTPKPAIR